MINRSIKIIHKLRVYFLVFISIAFLFVLGLSPVDVGKFVGSKFGQAVGMEIGVQENPFNKLALELRQKEEGLNAREQDLVAREQDLLAPSEKQNILILILGVGILILFVLILTNFYLDFQRRKKFELNSLNKK